MKTLMEKIVKDFLVEFIANIVYGNYRAMCTAIVGITSTFNDDLKVGLAEWNPGIFDVISYISHNFILPIAILVLTYVMVYELVTMVISSNNFHDVDTSLFIRWFFKLFLAIILLNHSFSLVVGIFQVVTNLTTQILSYLQGSAASVMTGSTAMSDFINDTGFRDTFVSAVTDMDIVESVGLLLRMLLISLVSGILGMIFIPLVSLIVMSRFFYSYIYAAFAPITFATLGSREIGQTGKRYIYNILALAFQLVVVVIVLAIFIGSCQNVMLSAISATGGDVAETFNNAMTINLMVSILTIVVLFKTESISKSIFSG